MAALCTCDHTVRTHNNVAVKVYIDLQCGKDYIVQFVHKCTFIKWICVSAGTDPVMVRTFYGFYCGSIEILCIQKFSYQALIQKVTHAFGHTAHCESHLDPALFHDLYERCRRCDRCTSNTGLICETIFEIRSIYNNLCTVIRHHQLSHICGWFRCTGSDLFRNTNLIYHADIINFCHVDICRIIRERHQTVCNSNYLVGMVSVYEGIGKDTTVAFSANAFTVSVIITGRRSDKGDIDYRFTGLDGTDTSAMGTHDGKSF